MEDSRAATSCMNDDREESEFVVVSWSVAIRSYRELCGMDRRAQSGCARVAKSVRVCRVTNGKGSQKPATAREAHTTACAKSSQRCLKGVVWRTADSRNQGRNMRLGRTFCAYTGGRGLGAVSNGNDGARKAMVRNSDILERRQVDGNKYGAIDRGRCLRLEKHLVLFMPVI